MSGSSGIPQDTRAPYRQQRWFEVENQEEFDIPPYSVVEIVDADRPEADDVMTPGGGRTIVKVQRPTCDSLCNVLVTGPVRIPAAEGEVKFTGPATNSFPSYARWGGTTPVVGASWGSVKDSFDLGEGRQGFKITGDTDALDIAGNTIVRVTRDPRLIRVRMQEDMLPGESGKQAKKLYFDEITLTWAETDCTVTVTDHNYWVCVLDQETITVECYGNKLITFCEFGLLREAVCTADVSAGAEGTANLCSAQEVATCTTTQRVEVSFCNGWRLNRKLYTDEEIWLRWLPCDRKWQLVNDRRHQVAQVVLDDNLCPADSNVSVSSFVSWEWATQANDPTKKTSSFTANNRFNLSGLSGAEALVAWNEDSEQWELIQVEHQAIELVEAVRLNFTPASGSAAATCKFEKKVRTFSLMTCGSAPSWEEVYSFTSVEALVDWFTDSEALEIKGQVQEFFVPCAGEIETVVLEDGTDCSTSSS